MSAAQCRGAMHRRGRWPNYLGVLPLLGLLWSNSAAAENVVVRAQTIACPSQDDLLVLDTMRASPPVLTAFVAKRRCEVLSAGTSYPVLARGPYAARLLLYSREMYVRLADLRR